MSRKNDPQAISSLDNSTHELITDRYTALKNKKAVQEQTELLAKVNKYEEKLENANRLYNEYVETMEEKSLQLQELDAQVNALATKIKDKQNSLGKSGHRKEDKRHWNALDKKCVTNFAKFFEMLNPEEMIIQIIWGRSKIDLTVNELETPTFRELKGVISPLLGIKEYDIILTDISGRIFLDHLYIRESIFTMMDNNIIGYVPKIHVILPKNETLFEKIRGKYKIEELEPETERIDLQEVTSFHSRKQEKAPKNYLKKIFKCLKAYRELVRFLFFICLFLIWIFAHLTTTKFAQTSQMRLDIINTIFSGSITDSTQPSAIVQYIIEQFSQFGQNDNMIFDTSILLPYAKATYQKYMAVSCPDQIKKYPQAFSTVTRICKNVVQEDTSPITITYKNGTNETFNYTTDPNSMTITTLLGGSYTTNGFRLEFPTLLLPNASIQPLLDEITLLSNFSIMKSFTFEFAIINPSVMSLANANMFIYVYSYDIVETGFSVDSISLNKSSNQYFAWLYIYLISQCFLLVLDVLQNFRPIKKASVSKDLEVLQVMEWKKRIINRSLNKEQPLTTESTISKPKNFKMIPLPVSYNLIIYYPTFYTFMILLIQVILIVDATLAIDFSSSVNNLEISTTQYVDVGPLFSTYSTLLTVEAITSFIQIYRLVDSFVTLIKEIDPRIMFAYYLIGEMTKRLAAFAPFLTIIMLALSLIQMTTYGQVVTNMTSLSANFLDSLKHTLKGPTLQGLQAQDTNQYDNYAQIFGYGNLVVSPLLQNVLIGMIFFATMAAFVPVAAKKIRDELLTMKRTETLLGRKIRSLRQQQAQKNDEKSS